MKYLTAFCVAALAAAQPASATGTAESTPGESAVWDAVFCQASGKIAEEYGLLKGAPSVAAIYNAMRGKAEGMVIKGFGGNADMAHTTIEGALMGMRQTSGPMIANAMTRAPAERAAIATTLGACMLVKERLGE